MTYRPLFDLKLAVLAVAASALVTYCAPAPAQTAVGLHVATYHSDRKAGFNEVNLGAYVIHNGWTAGAYHNSIRRLSVYGGYTFAQVARTPVDITVGAVTGYRVMPVMPMVVPSVKIADTVRLSLLVPFEKNSGGVHLSLEF